MDPFHLRLVRVGLAAIGRYGFCLAGGYAVQAHGFVLRRSEDVDLFTTASVEEEFPDAVTDLVAAFETDGLTTMVSTQASTFARLNVADSNTGESARVELGVDWRAYPPVQLGLGPVLHQDDAVANKFCALYGRGEVRDYIDVDGIVHSGRYSTRQLIDLARGHDPGFDSALFAQALQAIDRFPASAFDAYGLSRTDVAALVGRITTFADDVTH